MNITAIKMQVHRKDKKNAQPTNRPAWRDRNIKVMKFVETSQGTSRLEKSMKVWIYY